MDLKILLKITAILLFGCVENNTRSALKTAPSQVLVFQQDSIPVVKISNRSSFATPGFNRMPLLSESFEGNIFVKKDPGKFKTVILDEQREVFYSGDTFIPYILASGDTVHITNNSTDNKKFPYILNSENDIRNNEIVFFQEAALAGLPLLYWDQGNQMKGLISKKNVTNNLAELKKILAKSIQFSSDYFTREKTDAEFKGFIMQYLKFDHYIKVFYYLNQKTIDSLIKTNYFDFSVDTSSKFYHCNTAFQGAIYQYITYLQRKTSGKINVVGLFQLSDKYLAPAPSSLFKYMFIKNRFDSLYLASIDNLNSYIKNVGDKKYESVLETKRKDFEISLNHKNKFLDFNGKETIFSDVIAKNRGKLIYVDFWASWCAPCRKEFSNYEILKRRIKDATIEFIFVSLDRNIDVWKKAISAEGIDAIGEQYILLNASEAELNKLNIRAIPKYYLYDKNGKLVNNNAPSPGDTLLLDLISKYLR